MKLHGLLPHSNRSTLISKLTIRVFLTTSNLRVLIAPKSWHHGSPWRGIGRVNLPPCTFTFLWRSRILVSESKPLQLSIADEKTYLIVPFNSIVPFILLLGLAFCCRCVWVWLYHLLLSAPCVMTLISWNHVAPEPVDIFNCLKSQICDHSTIKYREIKYIQVSSAPTLWENLGWLSRTRSWHSTQSPSLWRFWTLPGYHGWLWQCPQAHWCWGSKVWTEVDNLVTKMTGYFKDNNDHRDAALPCLNHIFSKHRGIDIPNLAASEIGSVRTNGHNTVVHGTGSMTTEFKNWMTGIISLPQIELICYVARLNARVINEEACRELYLWWRVSCISLTIVGELDTSTFHVYLMLWYS